MWRVFSSGLYFLFHVRNIKLTYGVVCRAGSENGAEPQRHVNVNVPGALMGTAVNFMAEF